jgi:TonB family protein
MTRIHAILGSLLLAACASGPEPLTSREQDMKEQVDRIPIEAVRIPEAMREAQRRAGQPVMVVQGVPAVMYRDYQRAVPAANRSHLHVPQEVPDVQGCVVVSYDVRPDGKTDGFEIESSTPPTVFDRAALRALLATEYEPSTAPRPRQLRALWFLIARPPRAELSRVNETVEADRNKQREQQRAECMARAPSTKAD